MKIAHCAAVLLAVVLLSSCVGVSRGVYMNSFVSTGQPALTVSVPSLPLITSGEVIPTVTTSSSLSGIPVITDLAVYGSRKNDAGMTMAIVALSEAPSGWFWDPDTTSIFSLVKGTADISGTHMQACTYIIKGRNDAFATLAGGAAPDDSLWLARRFAVRLDVDKYKLTLEYREPLPANIPANATRMGELPFAEADAVRAFEKRAEQAFILSREPKTEKVAQTYPEGLRVRYMNRNFLGTLSSYSPMDK